MRETPSPKDGADGEGASRDPGPLRATVVVLALAGLAAAASHGTPAWTPLRAGRPDRVAILVDLGVLGLLGIPVALAVAMLLHRAVVVPGQGPRPLRSTLVRGLPVAAVVFAVLGLLAISGSGGDAARGRGAGFGLLPEGGLVGRLLAIRDDRVTGYVAGEDRTPAEEGTAGADAGDLPAFLLAVVALAAVAILVTASRRARRRQLELEIADPVPRRAGVERSTMREAVEISIDTMLADADPRTAIIGAYGRLLEGLEGCGAGRREHEGPMEHLHRVMVDLRVGSEPLRRLIGLFETARFSTHSLTTAHRERALEALRAVAADLAAISTTRPPLAGSRPVGTRG